MQRWISIWFPYWKTDELARRFPQTRQQAVVVYAREKGRMIITGSNAVAQHAGIQQGMLLADARALVADLQTIPDKPALLDQVLTQLAIWCIRFSPFVALDLPDGIWIDASGCAHLWGGESAYLNEIQTRMAALGYQTRITMADTLGAAWAQSRYGGETQTIIPPNQHAAYLAGLPPAALRLDESVVDKLNRLGLFQIRDLLNMPMASLRRRLGEASIVCLQQALGYRHRMVQPIQLPVEWTERLPCLDPVTHATGIEYAIDALLKRITKRLAAVEKGIRQVQVQAYRVDGKIETMMVQVLEATNETDYIRKLFQLKIPNCSPGPGIETFVLDVLSIGDITTAQSSIWNGEQRDHQKVMHRLMDRLSNKIGVDRVFHFQPKPIHWPEHSMHQVHGALPIDTECWPQQMTRPAILLNPPQPIQVAAPIPDYPPLLFRYEGVVHTIRKADGPERIEQPWWIQDGQHRDYFYVEDEDGSRYWLFRLGHYQVGTWFLHGYCV
jgi:protein ImuB